MKIARQDKVYMRPDSHQVTFLIDGIESCDLFKVHVVSTTPIDIRFDKKINKLNGRHTITVKKNMAKTSFDKMDVIFNNQFVLLLVSEATKIHFKNLVVTTPLKYQSYKSTSVVNPPIAIKPILKNMPKNYTCFLQQLDYSTTLNNLYHIETPPATNTKFPFNLQLQRDPDNNLPYIPIEELDTQPCQYWVKQYFFSNKHVDCDKFFAQLQFFGRSNWHQPPSNMYTRTEITDDRLDLDSKNLVMYGATSPVSLDKYMIISSISQLTISYNYQKTKKQNLTTHQIKLTFPTTRFESSRSKVYGGTFHILLLTFDNRQNEKVAMSHIANSIQFTDQINYTFTLDNSIQPPANTTAGVFYIQTNTNLYCKVYLYVKLSKYTLNQTAHLAFELEKI